jgi:hypothetical protein
MTITDFEDQATFLATDETTSAVQRAVNALADEIDENAATIRVVDPQWVQYLKAGCTVELHIRRWRAETTLTQADLGLRPASAEERQAWDAILQLGRRLLLPKAVVDRAERLDGQARHWLLANSFRTHWGAFLPAQRYRAWKLHMLELQQQYLALGQEIVATWDALQAQVRADYRVLGQRNYERLLEAGADDLPGEEEWVVGFVERALRSVPPRERVGVSFSFDWAVAYLPLASLLAEDQARAETILVESEAARQVATARARAATEMERDILAGARQRKEALLDTFAADVQAELRARVYDVCCDVLTALQKRTGPVPRGSVKQLKHLVEAVERLQFWDDAELEQQLDMVRQLLDRKPEQRSPALVRQAMERLGAESRLALLTLDRPPERSGRLLGIPDEAPALEVAVRQGRRTSPEVFEVLSLDAERSPRQQRFGLSAA